MAHVSTPAVRACLEGGIPICYLSAIATDRLFPWGGPKNGWDPHRRLCRIPDLTGFQPLMAANRGTCREDHKEAVGIGGCMVGWTHTPKQSLGSVP